MIMIDPVVETPKPAPRAVEACIPSINRSKPEAEADSQCHYTGPSHAKQARNGEGDCN